MRVLRSHSFLSLIFALVASIAIVHAQDRPLGPPPAGPPLGFSFGSVGPLGLLRIDEVREELGLDSDEKECLYQLRSKIREELSKSRSQESQESFSKLIRDLEKSLFEKLAPSKKDRLIGLLIQHEGALVFVGNRSLDEGFHISDEQRAAIDMMHEELKKDVQKLMEEGRSSDRKKFEKMLDDIKAKRRECSTKVAQLLTPDQRAQLEQMKGKTFEFPQRTWGRGPRNDNHEKDRDKKHGDSQSGNP